MFLGVLVAVPFVALAACSTVAIRDGFDDPAGDDNATGAQTTRADGDGGGPGIGASDATAEAPAAPGTEIDLATVTACDADLDVDGDVEDFLKAIGLCKMADADSDEWGVLEAKFTKQLGSSSANSNSGQHGILPKFGDVLTPREGTRLGVLSTGWAREYNGESGTAAFGSSKTWGGGSGGKNDMIVLALKIRVPMNAKSFSFDFNFHSSEWPIFVGSSYNDEFRVNLAGENISFDGNNNPVNVNNNFFDRCTPNVRLGDGSMSVCEAGTDELDGTGFSVVSGESRGGATGWLTTSAPVEPGSIIELEFATWDASDSRLDSLVLIDNFKWDADPVTTGTTRPVN